MTAKQDLDSVIKQLHEVESALSAAIAAFPEPSSLPYSREALTELKGLVDRIRPLLWIYLNPANDFSEEVKSSVEDCLDLANKAVKRHMVKPGGKTN